MKSNEIKEIIACGLKACLTKDGFYYNKTKNEFQKIIGSFTYIFNIEQVKWSNSYSVDVHLRISVMEIENILKTILGSNKYKVTLGQIIGRIYKSPDGREIINGDLSIWIRHKDEIYKNIELLKYYYKNIAKKYFNRFKTLEDVDDIINNPPFDYTPAYVGGFYYARCIRGLIVAKLVDNPNYNNLVDIYNKEIYEINNPQFTYNYIKVRNYLSNTN